ncbi:hypothetical protein [Jiangella rhizosphaerae]|uniref:HNH endonuclease n=1 Tax=Jiangella rhizosphaerae TaxID=2293569 RepID=A0A418KHU6_9ACTN|nr:hypothetical protein [Jiangella rhizosphaerae]RIQ11599.1 hypothetical protein DY240_28425 [Jiangella rhizosphaerae]
MKYTPEALAAAVAASTSVAGVLRHLGVKPTGGSHAHLSRRIKALGLDTSHFTGRAHNKGQTSPRRLGWAEILVTRPPGSADWRPHDLRFLCPNCHSQTATWAGANRFGSRMPLPGTGDAAA